MTLDEETIRLARVQAAERNMSLSRYIGELLRDRMRHSREYERAMRAALSVKPLKLQGEYLKREELYERSRIR